MSKQKKPIKRELIKFELGDCKPCSDVYAIRQTRTKRYYCYALCDQDGMGGYCFGWSFMLDKAIKLMKEQVALDSRYILNTTYGHYTLTN